MKKTVCVTRTEFAAANFEIEIPDNELIDLSASGILGAFEANALVQAEDYDFGSGNAEYEVASVDDPEEAGL